MKLGISFDNGPQNVISLGETKDGDAFRMAGFGPDAVFFNVQGQIFGVAPGQATNFFWAKESVRTSRAVGAYQVTLLSPGTKLTFEVL